VINLNYFGLVGLLLLATPLAAAAQTSALQLPQPDTVPNAAPAAIAPDLRISPRLGIGHDSSGAGYDGFTSFEGFVPLRQTPGENLTFLDTRLLLDNDGKLGGNLILGHRFYDLKRDRIWGGYLGLDLRNTDVSSFSQLGLGVESLGEVWDFRINGYLPLTSRQLVDEQGIGTGKVRVSTQFQDHLLLLSQERQQTIARTWEAALGGLDAEVGGRLAHWQGGDLRGYGGLYFYDAAGTEGTLGWRLRLEGRATDDIRLGVSLQDDDKFGTNIAFSLGLTLPRVHPRGPITEAETVVARIAEPIQRTNAIALDRQQETEIKVERTTRPLMNPEEEAAYWFQHVTLGAQGGDGTFERPFGTMQAALAATRSDGNDIVYVDQGNNAAIPAFTIPDRVQVLSQAPDQILAGMPFPGFSSRQVRLPFSPTFNFNNGIRVRLPLSRDGNFPTIQDSNANNLVTMGDRTTLSGFQLADARENGIVGSNVANVEIRDNTITNAGDRGIFLENVADSVVMFDNRVTGSRGGTGSGQGILIRNDGDTSVEVTMTNHQLTNNRVGLELAASGNGVERQGDSQRVTITNATIQNNREQGLQLSAEQFGNQEVTLTRGVISNNGADGVRLQGNRAGSQEFTIGSSTINQNAGHGIRVQGGNLGGASTAAQEVFIQDNAIERNGGDGISIESNEVSAQEFAIERNSIRNNGGAGVRGTANNVSFQEYVSDSSNGSSGLGSNIISGNGDQGIDLTANDSATLVADIQANRLEGNRTGGRPDLEVTSTSNSANVCTVVLGNISLAGIRLDNNTTGVISGLFEVGEIGRVASQNTGAVVFSPNLSAFTNKPGATSCFR
jgi:trimeric autotransporter adhesin